MLEEETQELYWTNPEVTAVSIGSIDNLMPTNGKVTVSVETAVYLVSVRPDLFSVGPPATGIVEIAVASAPEKTEE